MSEQSNSPPPSVARPAATTRSGASSPPSPYVRTHKTSAEAAAAVDFLEIIGQLKTRKRTGWVRSGVKLPESIADHMYRMAVCALIVPESACVDTLKCAQMAIAHDMAEAIVGDITPQDPISKEEKHRLEHDAMMHMQRVLQDAPAAKRLVELFMEYENGETPEATMVKDIDKFEMILQAYEYERDQSPIQLGDFFDGVRGKWRTNTIQLWADEVTRRRTRLQADIIADNPKSRRQSAAEISSPPVSTGSTRTHSWARSLSTDFYVGLAVGALVAGAAVAVLPRVLRR